MLEGDILALNVYENVYKDQPDILVDYSKIHHCSAFETRFKNYGAAEDVRAVITAQHWIASSGAVDLIEGNPMWESALCSATQTLGITNHYLECDI